MIVNTTHQYQFVMKDTIAKMHRQIDEAVAIGKSASFHASDREIRSVVLVGLGGSGIGGQIVRELLKNELKVPFICVNDYHLPEFVNSSTLLVASSYSGNTEETLSAVGAAVKKDAEIAVITSGGKLGQWAKNESWNHAIVPKGEQPRAMLVYSIVQQLYLLHRYGLVAKARIEEIENTTSMLVEHEMTIRREAEEVANKLYQTLPIIYADASFGGVAKRFKQQINENSKELCWTDVLPEMTHNELVGWAGGQSYMAPVYLATDYDHPRTTHRWNISKKIMGKTTQNIVEIQAKGDSPLAQTIYLIHLTDWVSWFLSDLKKVDASEVDVIDYLKSEMAKLE